MKRLRVLSLALLIGAIGLFIFCKVDEMKNSDNLAPVIRMDDTSLEISVKDDTDKLLEGLNATDVKDGDVSSSIVLEGISNFMGDGRRLVTYAAFDSSNNVSKATRQITYSDYTSPRFSLSSPLIYPTGSSDLLDSITVEDCLDGDITDKVQFTDGYELYSDVAGEYKVQLEVTNSAGDTAVLPVTYTIYDSSTSINIPSINLSDYILYVEKGKKPDWEDYLESVDIGGIEYAVVSGNAGDDEISESDISINDKKFDSDTPGEYEVTYSYKSDNDVIGKVRLIVVVEEK